MSLQFGNFTAICRDSYLAVCNLWTPQPTRSCTLTQYQVSGGSVKNIGMSLNPFYHHYRLTLFYVRLGDVAICGISIVLVLIVMYRTYKKQAAVGRSEMNILYTFFAVQLTFQLITSGGFVSDTTMQMLSGLQMGFVVGFFWVLMVNGFVGYQWIEDGSWVSWLGTLLSGLVWTVVVTVLALDVPFKITGGNTSTSMYFSSQLFGLYLLFPLILIFIYIVAETVLVYQYLGDQKPLGTSKILSNSIAV